MARIDQISRDVRDLNKSISNMKQREQEIVRDSNRRMKRVEEEYEYKLRGLEEDTRKEIIENRIILEQKYKKELEERTAAIKREQDEAIDKIYEEFYIDSKRIHEELAAQAEILKKTEEDFETLQKKIENQERTYAENAREEFNTAQNAYKEFINKPHQFFLPEKKRFFERTIRQIRAEIGQGLFESALGNAVSLQLNVAESSVELDEAVREWKRIYEQLKKSVKEAKEVLDMIEAVTSEADWCNRNEMFWCYSKNKIEEAEGNGEKYKQEKEDICATERFVNKVEVDGIEEFLANAQGTEYHYHTNDMYRKVREVDNTKSSMLKKMDVISENLTLFEVREDCAKKIVLEMKNIGFESLIQGDYCYDLTIDELGGREEDERKGTIQYFKDEVSGYLLEVCIFPITNLYETVINSVAYAVLDDGDGIMGTNTIVKIERMLKDVTKTDVYRSEPIRDERQRHKKMKELLKQKSKSVDNSAVLKSEKDRLKKKVESLEKEKKELEAKLAEKR